MHFLSLKQVASFQIRIMTQWAKLTQLVVLGPWSMLSGYPARPSSKQQQRLFPLKRPLKLEGDKLVITKHEEEFLMNRVR